MKFSNYFKFKDYFKGLKQQILYYTFNSIFDNVFFAIFNVDGNNLTIIERCKV